MNKSTYYNYKTKNSTYPDKITNIIFDKSQMKKYLKKKKRRWIIIIEKKKNNQ